MANNPEKKVTTDRPILFSAPMVRALLEGRKTQTRRVIKLHCGGERLFFKEKRNIVRVAYARPDGFCWNSEDPDDFSSDQENWIPLKQSEIERACPYGKPGDLLWVRENFAFGSDFYGPARAFYQADHVNCSGRQSCEDGFHKWTPSIHMPRAYSRLTLELTAVRVQRLNDISEEDAIAEGCGRSAAGLFCGGPHKAHGFPRQFNTAREAFRDLWESINGPGSWAESPWVWALTFTVHPVNIDVFLKEKKS